MKDKDRLPTHLCLPDLLSIVAYCQGEVVLLSYYYQASARFCLRQWRLDAASHLASSICSQQPCFWDLSEPVTREAEVLGQRPAEPTPLHSHHGSPPSSGSCQPQSPCPLRWNRPLSPLPAPFCPLVPLPPSSDSLLLPTQAALWDMPGLGA